MAITSYLNNGKKLYEVYVNGTDSRGVRFQKRKKGFETLRKAEQAEFELKRELAMLRESKVPYRWSEWCEVCLKRMKLTYRPSTCVDYETRMKKWIHPRWGNLEIQHITRDQVYEVIFEQLEMSEHSRKTILKIVRRLFAMAVEEGILDRNPCTGIQVKVAEVEQKVLTNNEVEIFLREAKATGHRFYPVWVMALMTGMRSGELYALRWTDVDLEGRIISVSKAWNSKNGFTSTKTQRSRVVPISDDLLKFLKELKLKRGAESEFVLPHLSEWTCGQLAQVTREFCEAIGVTSVKFHDLRATFITNLLARGQSLARVMSVVGHSQLKTTNGYLRKAGVDVQGATEILGYKVPEESSAKILSLLKQT